MHIASYAIALGSNRRHGKYGSPRRILLAARVAIEAAGIEIASFSPIRHTHALGPAGRSFANAASILRTSLSPPELLILLKQIERSFGRRGGRRWGPRILDLDILLWSGGVWKRRGLSIPHPSLHARHFVLEPLAEIAPDWRHPSTGAAMRHLLHRLKAPRPAASRGLIG